MKTLIKYEFLKVLRKKSTLIAIAVSPAHNCCFLFALPITTVFKFIIKIGRPPGGWKVLHTKKNSMRTFSVPLNE